MHSTCVGSYAKQDHVGPNNQGVDHDSRIMMTAIHHETMETEGWSPPT